jgi:hypothetical protein
MAYLKSHINEINISLAEIFGVESPNFPIFLALPLLRFKR